MKYRTEPWNTKKYTPWNKNRSYSSYILFGIVGANNKSLLDKKKEPINKSILEDVSNNLVKYSYILYVSFLSLIDRTFKIIRP